MPRDGGSANGKPASAEAGNELNENLLELGARSGFELWGGGRYALWGLRFVKENEGYEDLENCQRVQQ